MTLLMSIFLGFVQGLTEFLPVSSSGHLSILQNIFKLHYSESEHLFFDVLLHMGTLIAIILVYKKDIKAIFEASVEAAVKTDDIGYRARNGRLSPNARMGVLLAVGTIPLLIVLPFYSSIKKLYSNTLFIGFALIISGAILFVADRFEQGRKNGLNMTMLDALIVGIAQAVSVLPGFSRSGATVAAGISRDLKKDFAVKYSIILSIPAVLGAMVVTFFDAISAGIKLSLLPIYFVGAAVAAVTGYFSLNIFRYIIIKNKFKPISYYCFAAGVITLIAALFL